MQLPSASNTAGTLLGTLAGTAVATTLPGLPFAIAAAAFLGVTPLGLAGGVAVIATALVNYAVTHVAEVKNLNELVAAWWPQIQQVYPTGKNGETATQPVSAGTPNENINQV